MNGEPITLNDIKSLDFLAETILHEMRFNGFFYDENGEYRVPCEDERSALITTYRKDNVLEFRECTIFRELSLTDICSLPLEDIQRKYLADVLPKACAMMRKQAWVYVNAELSPEITDEYLKDLFAIRWRDNAMFWIAQIDKSSEPDHIETIDMG